MSHIADKEQVGGIACSCSYQTSAIVYNIVHHAEGG